MVLVNKELEAHIGHRDFEDQSTTQSTHVEHLLWSWYWSYGVRTLVGRS